MSRFTPRAKLNIKKAPPAEKTSFEAFAKVKPDVELEEEEIDNIVKRMMELGPKCYMAFVLLSKDDVRKKKLAAETYSEDTYASLHVLDPDHAFSRILSGFLFRSLVKAAGQIAANIIYTNDGGKAYTAMMGAGQLHRDKGWVVNKVLKNRAIVPISSAHAVDLQLFCSSVDLGRTQTQILHEGVLQTISKPSVIQKNRVENCRIELALKKMFTGLLVLPEKEELTDEDVKRAPWLWKAVFNSCADIKIPITGLPLELVYFSFVRKSYDYVPFPVDVQELLYANYDNVMKELLDQVAKHSVFRGGYFLSKYHFFNEGLKIAACRTVGGVLPVKWCAFNTVREVTWEREGAFIEGGNLGTTVIPAQSFTSFKGLFYDPTLCADKVFNAKGVIVPYDRNGTGIAALEKWLLGRSSLLKLDVTDMKFQIYATYGPAPLLWVIHVTHEDDCPNWGPYRRPAVDILWKSMGSMPLFNLCASLNEAAARAAAVEAQADDPTVTFHQVATEWEKAGVPVKPVLVADFSDKLPVTWDYEVSGASVTRKVPGYKLTYLDPDALPGRHQIDSAIRRKQSEVVAGAWDGYEEFAKPDPFVPPADGPRKRAKPDEPHVAHEGYGEGFAPPPPREDHAMPPVTPVVSDDEGVADMDDVAD